ncbi:DEAD/DEAH box helicase [Actinospica sp.]|uniref:DEAD/DEAH box helicase n=1 Tax=Actinospica sp. TaxID=1872142 RepID=UPI002CFAFB91|nr:DEAD/DEAH box helicase [Actinospica sp.]HWG24329.1 DEAD/DEAH box helicase [Actinospica sp.]
MTSGFAALGVAGHIVEALDGLGISVPFPIQASTIPVALGGADIIGQAKTGTGKTLAFGVPVLQRLKEAAEAPRPATAAATSPAAKAAAAAGGSGRRRGRSSGGNAGAKLPPAGGTPQALIVVPTRELAVQVCADLAGAGSTKSVRVQALYGGRAYEPQVKALTEGIDVAVATPGRLLDLVNQGHLVLGQVRTLVLDEADEMLDLGFLPDVERIIRLLPADRQTMLFSATMPGAVISLARQYMNRPTHIRAADPHDEGISVANIKQVVYRAHDLDKIEMLARILQARDRGLTMVFARTKRAVARITEELQDRHFAVGAVHGDLAQGAREQALRAFRNGKVDVLVATDVAARGIDVEGVTHVVNYQCPEDEKVYTHRIGRTGRAGRTGISVTLVDWEDMPRWGLINKALGLDLAEPVELYSTSPQLYADLDIPQGVKGALPKQDRVRAGLDAEELEDLGETGRHGGGGGGGGGRGRGRDGRRGAEAAAPAEQPEPRRERTPRQRRRTRGGQSGSTDVIAVHTEQAAAHGAAPVVQSQADPFRAPTLERAAAQGAETAEKPKRTRTRTRAAGFAEPVAEPVVETVVESAPVVVEAAPEAQVEEKPKRARTRKRTAAVAEPVAEAIAETNVEAAPVAEAPAEERPAARKRTRKRTNVAEAPIAERTEIVAASVADAVAPVEEKPVRKRAPRKTTAKRTAAAVDGAETAAAPAAAAAEKPARKRTAPAANPRGGSIRLAPGSLADPSLPQPEPVRPAAVNEPVELAEPVFTQEPILPAAQRAERPPRKRSAKKSVAAQAAPGPQVTSTLPGEEHTEDAVLNLGPVANRRRTQV